MPRVDSLEETLMLGGIGGRMLRGPQAPRRAVCGTRMSLRMMHGGGSAPSCCAFTHTPAACSFPGENARSWEALGEARPGQSSLSAGALRYRAWAQPILIDSSL